MNAMILLAQGAMNMADSLATANPVHHLSDVPND